MPSPKKTKRCPKGMRKDASGVCEDVEDVVYFALDEIHQRLLEISHECDAVLENEVLYFEGSAKERKQHHAGITKRIKELLSESKKLATSYGNMYKKLPKEKVVKAAAAKNKTVKKTKKGGAETVLNIYSMTPVHNQILDLIRSKNNLPAVKRLSEKYSEVVKKFADGNVVNLKQKSLFSGEGNSKWTILM